MKAVLVVWCLIGLALAALVVLVAPWLPAVPEEDEEHGGRTP